jgi:hypothetical protein
VARDEGEGTEREGDRRATEGDGRGKWECRVHPANKAIMMEIIPNTSKVLVKAADPLAEPDIPLYYTHSKTYLYNDIFFHFWDT